MRRFWRRNDDFADPVPLDPGLHKYINRVATLREFGAARAMAGVSGDIKGYLYLVKTVIGRAKHRGKYVEDSRAEEVLQINLVVLRDGRESEYLQVEYDRAEALRELARDRFRLYGKWYELQWLTGSAAGDVLGRYFVDPVGG